MSEFEPNCFGCAFKRLRINPDERYIDPRDVEWEKHFKEVETALEADAVLVFDNNPLEGVEIVHIAVMDKYNKGLLWHKPQRGFSERSVRLSDFMFECFRQHLEIQFVKVEASG